jgi:hypothetical protein
MLIPVGLALTACSGSGKYVSLEPINLVAAPAELRKSCEGPGALGDKAMTQAAVERAWRKDRANLVTCKKRHGAVVGFYTERDRRIGGNK